MSLAKSTTSLPTCVSKSSELSGCPSPTRPANLHTATSARYFVRQRTTCKTTASLERSENVGTAALGCPAGQSPAALLSARTEKRTPGELRPLDSRGRLSLRHRSRSPIDCLLFL